MGPKPTMKKRGARSSRASSGPGAKTSSSSSRSTRAPSRLNSSGGKSYKEDYGASSNEDEESEADVQSEPEESESESDQSFEAKNRVAPRATSSRAKKSNNKSYNKSYNEDSEDSEMLDLDSDSDSDDSVFGNGSQKKPAKKPSSRAQKKPAKSPPVRSGSKLDDQLELVEKVFEEEEEDALSDTAEENQIKPAKSAYRYFQAAMGPEIKKQIISSASSALEAPSGPDLLALMGKQTSAMWKTLSDEEKEPYLEQHRKDKERCEKENAERDAYMLERAAEKRRNNYEVTTNKRVRKTLVKADGQELGESR